MLSSVPSGGRSVHPVPRLTKCGAPAASRRLFSERGEVSVMVAGPPSWRWFGVHEDKGQGTVAAKGVGGGGLTYEGVEPHRMGGHFVTQANVQQCIHHFDPNYRDFFVVQLQQRTLLNTLCISTRFFAGNPPQKTCMDMDAVWSRCYHQTNISKSSKMYKTTSPWSITV